MCIHRNASWWKSWNLNGRKIVNKKQEGFLESVRRFCGDEAAQFAASGLEEMELRFEPKVDCTSEMSELFYRPTLKFLKQIADAAGLEIPVDDIEDDHARLRKEIANAVRTLNAAAFTIGWLDCASYIYRQGVEQ